MKAKGYLKDNIVCVVTFLVLSIVQIFVIFPLLHTDNGISYDSSYMYGLMQHSVSEIWRLIPLDYSPPFYQMALKLYISLFGNSLFVMRTFTLFAVVGMLFIAAFPMRTLFGKKSAFFCLILTFASFNTLSIYHEIRPTIFGFFFFMAVVVYAVLAYDQGKRYAYICLTVFSVLAMYTHNVSLVGTFCVYVILILISLITKNWKKLKYFFISGGICALLYLPWLKVILTQISNVQEHYWVTTASFGDVLQWTFFDFKHSYDNVLLSEILLAFIIVILLAALFKHVNFKKLKGAKSFNEIFSLTTDKKVYFNLLLLVLFLAFSLAMMEIVSMIMHNIRSSRYYYILAVVWIIILSVLLGNFGYKIINILFAGLMMISFSLNVVSCNQKADISNMQQMVKELEELYPNGDICFLHTHEQDLGIMTYYFPNAKHYVYDKTFTVLKTYDCFSAAIEDIGDINNIWNHTDKFLTVINNTLANSEEIIVIEDELAEIGHNKITPIEKYYNYVALRHEFDIAEVTYDEINTPTKE